MAAEGFKLAGRRPVELHFADVAADLHAVGPGIHTQRPADSAGNAYEPFHSPQVVFGAEGNRAAEVRRCVDMGEVTIEDTFGIGTNELEDHPEQFAIAAKQA